jgi:ribosomal protein L30/L7E
MIQEGSSLGMGSLFGFLFSLLPLLILAFVLRWIRLVKINSEKQVEQNKEIIGLLRDINQKIGKGE